MLKSNYMSTTKQIKHLLKTNVFGITDKIKAFQKPRRDKRSNNRRVRG